MIKEPESMDELVYHTNRFIGENGMVRCWVYRQKCPKCGKGIMSKPTGKSGKVKIKAKEYVCPECGYTVDSKEYEETLTAQAKYTCPKCSHEGEIELLFKRKKMKLFDDELQKNVSVHAIIFPCQKCGNKIPVTKKMK